MEFRLGSILIESAIKLASLSDCVDVLVLVDTPTGRLFSGNGTLIENFLSSTLTPTSNDLRLYIDPFVPPQMGTLALSQSIFSSQLPTHHAPRQSREPKSHQNANFIAKRKRPSVGNNDDTSTKAKRFSSGEMTTKCEMDDEVVVDAPPLTNDAQINSLPVDGVSTITPGDGSSADSLHDSRSASQIIKTEVDRPSNSQVDELIELSSGDESSSSFSGSRFRFNQNSLVSAELSSGDQTDELNGFDAVVFTVNSAVPAMKLEAFRSTPGELVSSRGSVENRLASSVAYDAGKALADLKPDVVVGEAAKLFFNRHFEAWISQFENVREHLKTMIPNGKPELGQTFTLLALLKMTARAAFKQKLKTKAKR